MQWLKQGSLGKRLLHIAGSIPTCVRGTNLTAGIKTTNHFCKVALIVKWLYAGRISKHLVDLSVKKKFKYISVYLLGT